MKKIMLLVFGIVSTINLYSNKLELWSESAIVIDFETDYIIFKKNIDEKLSPASMTKLVTLYVLYEDIRKGVYYKDTLVPISKEADWRSLPRESSLMFIEEGHKVTVLELMKGLAISSGNDAAIAIAEFVSGSVEKFVDRMNLEMKKLGLADIFFDDPSGYSSKNRITALEYVQFCKLLLKNHPESIEELFSLQSYLYPKKHNGITSIGGILQYNRNKLVTEYPGCDGLKTGFINESGMNIALTAKRDNLRVIAILIGAKDKNKKRAEQKRYEDAVKILDYSFNNFKYVQLDKIDLPIIESMSIKPQIPYKKKILINKNSFDMNYNLLKIEKEIYIDTKIGSVIINNGNEVLKFPIVGNKLFH